MAGRGVGRVGVRGVQRRLLPVGWAPCTWRQPSPAQHMCARVCSCVPVCLCVHVQRLACVHVHLNKKFGAQMCMRVGAPQSTSFFHCPSTHRSTQPPLYLPFSLILSAAPCSAPQHPAMLYNTLLHSPVPISTFKNNEL